MESKNLFDEFADSIPIDDAGAHCYEKSCEYFAVFGNQIVDCGANVFCTLESPAVTIYEGRLDSFLLEKIEGAICAVYKVDGTGSPAVPTGSVLVRLADGERIDEFRDELEAVGYQLESDLSYAPQAGWVRPKSGRIADSIRDLQGLKKLPRVVHCELQMVQVAEKKN